MTYIIRLILAYLWLRKTQRSTANGIVSAIVPTYNEDPVALDFCVTSLVHQCNEVIVVDDGSDVPVEYSKKWGDKVRVFRLKKNSGKKEAEYWGLVTSTGDFIVTVDSDTVMESDFVKNAMPYFSDKVGAVVGDVQIGNQKGVNRIMSKVYFNAFSLWRAGMSFFGQVPVCSGAASVYRREVFEKNIEAYRSRKYNIGNDRYMTFLTLKNGYKTVFSPESVAYTVAPTGKKFLNQQTRWNQSFWMSLAYSWPLYIRLRFLPFTIDMFLKAFSRLATIGMLALLIISSVRGDWSTVGYILLFTLIRGLMGSIYGVVTQRSLSYLLLTPWAFISLFVISLVNVKAIMSIGSDNWRTR